MCRRSDFQTCPAIESLWRTRGGGGGGGAVSGGRGGGGGAGARPPPSGRGVTKGGGDNEEYPPPGGGGGGLLRVESEEEARARIEEMKKRYYDARHNCWCYLHPEGGRCATPTTGSPRGRRASPCSMCSSGRGSPTSAAWSPGTLAGILLGGGGLVRAYTQSAKDALDAAGISVVRRWVEVLVPCPYTFLSASSRRSRRLGRRGETEYGADVTLTVLLPEEKAEAYLATSWSMTAGTVEGIATGERFQDVPWRSAGGAGGPRIKNF